MFNRPAWLSPLLLVLVFLASLLTQLNASLLPAQLAVVAIVAFTLIEWKKIEFASKVLATLALGLIVALVVTEKLKIAQLLSMCTSVAFFVFFLLSLSLLKEAALTSQAVLLTGRAMLQQQPTRRYAMLSIASHLVGILMSMGAINLFATMIKRSLQDRQTSMAPQIYLIRQQRMMQAVTRGFCSIPLWAPTTVTITLLVTTIPNLQWIDIMPIGLILAATALLFGIVLDFAQAPKNLNHLLPSTTNKLSDLQVAGPVFMVVAGLAALAALLIFTTPLSTISSVLVSASLTSCIWIYWQHQATTGSNKALQLTWHRFRHKIFYNLAAQRSEVVFFASSVLIGQVLLKVLDIAWFNQLVTALNLSPTAVLISASWLIFISSLLYINPIISVTFIAGALAQLPALTTMPVTIALVMMVTWAVVIGSSPTSASVRIGAKIAQVSPGQLGLKWNGLYSLLILLALDGYLIVFL